MAALLLLTGPCAGLRYEVKGEATLGRSPSCEVPLEDGKVSRRHAKISLIDGQAHVSDLGSRNGTIVNGEKIEGEAVLLPGDRLQIGDSTIVFEPPVKASLADREAGEVKSVLVEEVLPAVGPEAALYSAGSALLAATSEAMVLRRAAEELARFANAERAAALLGGSEGLFTAAVVGGDGVELARSLVRAAMERKETSIAGGTLCAPLTASGGMPFGVLYAQRPEPFGEQEQRLAGALGRLAGEAFAAVRSRSEPGRSPVVLVGGSRQFRKTVEQARRAAAASDPVVLFGESGSGKTLAAEYIHARSSRALGPWVVVDCRQSPVAVDEALFGRPSAPGVPPLSAALLRADGGTLLLQHLEGLQRHSAERLARHLTRKLAPALRGGEEPVDVRIIATSSKKELAPELAEALAGIEVELLPLRERRTDVLALFDTFTSQVARVRRKEPPTLSPDAKRLLSDYAWPGNVRELRLVAEHLALLFAGVEVSALMLPPVVQEGAEAGKMHTLHQRVARLERDAISEALREAGGKKIQAAAILGISRPTLDKKIEDYQLVVEKTRGAPSPSGRGSG
ncbi:MAG: FHA domain-containing protein [Myxococcota bacterium]